MKLSNTHILRLAGVLSLGVALLIGVPGCGGGDSSSTTETLSKSQYVKRADAICQQAEKRQLKLVVAFQKKGLPRTSKTEQELVEFAGVPPLATEAEELAELPPPTTASKQAKAFLAAFRAGVEKAEKNPLLLLDITKDPFKEARSLAGSYGFEVCRGA